MQLTLAHYLCLCVAMSFLYLLYFDMGPGVPVSHQMIMSSQMRGGIWRFSFLHFKYIWPIHFLDPRTVVLFIFPIGTPPVKDYQSLMGESFPRAKR